MPDINNSLAEQIKVPQIDLAGSLGKAAQINLLNASTARTQQEVEHKQFLYDQGGGYDPSELNTLQQTREKHMENAGRIGSAYLANPTDDAWTAAVDDAHKVGLIQGGSLEKAQYLALPPDKRSAVAQALQKVGQPSGASIEQTGIPAGNQTREAGKYIPQGIPFNEPIISRTAAATGGGNQPSQSKVDNAIKSGKNFDGSPRVLSTADVVGIETPNQAVSDRFPNQSIFQPRVIKNPDGSISSSVTPETQGLQASAVERFKQMQDNAGRAQGLMSQLDQIEHENEVLNSKGWSSTGSNAQQKLSTAKSINSFFTSLGMPAPIDPSKVAAGESYNKLTFRAGADFAKTLGGNPAESVVQNAVSATPNVENTYYGSKVITNSIRQAVQREVDMYRYTLDYAKRTGSTFGAEDEFNRKFPPDLYSKTAIANAIPPQSVSDLKTHPELAKDFDAKYGRGMSKFIIGQ